MAFVFWNTEHTTNPKHDLECFSVLAEFIHSSVFDDLMWGFIMNSTECVAFNVKARANEKDELLCWIAVMFHKLPSWCWPSAQPTHTLSHRFNSSIEGGPPLFPHAAHLWLSSVRSNWDASLTHNVVNAHKSKRHRRRRLRRWKKEHCISAASATLRWPALWRQ